MSDASAPNLTQLWTPKDRAKTIALAAVWALAAFAINSYLAFAFARLQAFNTGDVLFGADAIFWWDSFADGTDSRGLVHPNVNLMFSPILRLISAIAGLFGSAAGDPVALRRTLALFVCPLFSGAKVAALFLLYRLLKMSLLTASIAVLLCVVSFSQVVFGTAPESFGLTGGLLAFLLLQAALADKFPKWDKPWIWSVHCFLLGSVTITNVVPFCIVYLLFNIHRHGLNKKALLRTTLVAAVATACIVAFAIPLNVLSSSSSGVGDATYWSTRYLAKDPVIVFKRAMKFPAMLWHTIVPGEPEIFPNGVSAKHGFLVTLAFQFTAPFSISALLLSLSVPPFLLGGFFAWWREGGVSRALALACALILSFNFIFHSFWGDWVYTYSQHWHAALLFLLAGLLTVDTKWKRWVAALFSLCVLAIALSSGLVIEDILSQIRVQIGGS